MNKEVEIWKDIPGYEGLYQVSSLGRVKSLPKEWVSSIVRKHNGKILKASNSGITGGYIHVVLSCDSNKKTYKVHQLVAMAFLNHKPNGYKIVVDHINNIKTDNRLENLQLISQRENVSKDRKGSSKYTGVYCDKNVNKWRSTIVINGKTKYLGTFDTEEEASKYYQDALKSIEEGADIKVKIHKYSSKYKGVNFDKSRCKWRSTIVINGKQKYLGRFKCELAASHAYQKALKELL